MRARDSPCQRRPRACCLGQYPSHDRAFGCQAHGRAPSLTRRSLGRHGFDDAPGGRREDGLWVVGSEGGTRGTLPHGVQGSASGQRQRAHTSAILSLVIIPVSPAKMSEGRARRGQRERDQEHTGGAMDDEEDRGRRQGFADHLNYLFAAQRRPDGLPYTLREVGQATGCAVTYLGLLRTQCIAVLPDPARQERLTAFFGVSATFFATPLPDDAADVLARHRQQLAAALRHVHLCTRPLGAHLDLMIAGEMALHMMAHAVTLRETGQPAEHSGTPPASSGERVAGRGPGPQGGTGQRSVLPPRRPSAWWRRLWPR